MRTYGCTILQIQGSVNHVFTDLSFADQVQWDQCSPGNSASHYSDQNMNGILVDFCGKSVAKIMEDIKIDMKCFSKLKKDCNCRTEKMQ